MWLFYYYSLLVQLTKLIRNYWCRAQNGIDEMCRDQWNWASNNPCGYRPSKTESPEPVANGTHEPVINKGIDT